MCGNQRNGVMRNRTTDVVKRLLMIGAFAAHASRLFAQTGHPVSDLGRATLEELINITITTASRTSEWLSDAPARVQVVTAAQIRRRGYRSLSDVLKDLPDFKVDLAGNWDFPAELTVQGVRGAGRVIVLLDGIRISSPTNEPLPIVANYPVHTARQIEIVYGPASAVYGADAFSAVINIISKDAGESTGLAVSTSVGAFGLYNQTASYVTPLGTNASLVVAGQFLYDGQPDLSRYYPGDFNGMQAQRAGTFPTVFGSMTPSQPVSPDYHIPLSAHSMQATLHAGGFQFTLFENRSHLPSTAGVYTPDNVVYSDIAFNENVLFVGAGTYTRAIGRATSTSTLTLSRQELNPNSGYQDLYSNMRRSYKYAYGSMAEIDQQISWKPTSTVTVTTGGSFQRFLSVPQTADLNAPIKSQDAPGTILGTNIVDEFVKLRYANTGTFAQMRYAMTPRIALTLGGRGDYNTRYGGTFNPRLGIVANATASTTLKLLYGTAYLAPSPYQGYAHYGSFISADGGATFSSPYWHLPNSDLKPQLKKTAEATVNQRLGPNLNLSASAFYSRFTNLIWASDAAQAYTGFYHGWPVDYIDFPVNQGRETTYGGTFQLEAMKSFAPDRQFAAHAGLSVADGRIWPESSNGDSLPIGAMVPVQLRAGVDLDWDSWQFAPRLAIVGKQRVLATTTGDDGLVRRTLDGYSTVDVNVRRRNLFAHLDAFVTVENAFDRRYRSINERAFTNPEEFVGIPQNPRRITVGLELRLR
jgi:outer membrane receptor for ferrienterochelin and colicin